MGTLAAVLTLALLAGADRPPPDARTYGARGADEYLQHRYEDAARDLLKAYDLFPAPILLYNLGQCERAQGHLDRAISYYEQYLVAAPNASNAVAAQAKLQEALNAKNPRPDLSPHEGSISLLPPASEVQQASPPLDLVLQEAPIPPPRSHWVGAGLATAAAVCAGFAVFGAVRVAQYGQIQTAQTWPEYQQALATNANAQNWEYAAIGLAIAAAGGATAAIFTW